VSKSKNAWKKDIKESQDYRCVMCGRQFSNRGLQIHHCRNRCRGGKSNASNCCAVCV